MSASSATRAAGPGTSMPSGKTMVVHSEDGTRLHTEVFGPSDGYPIVLAHGLTCALRVWHRQISELSRDFRVIAYDHRGHGRSGVPGRRSYSLDHLAADLDAVLGATLRSGERAVIAGHSMGGVAISAWSDRFRHRVGSRADAVALINTTTGELLEELQLLRVPGPLAAGRLFAARHLVRALGGAPLLRGAQPGSRWFVTMMALGAGTDPAVARFLHDLFAATPPAGRGSWARALVDEMGAEHIDLSGLTVPTLVIGGAEDRLLPMSQTRKIADAAPNLLRVVELPGGHCAQLEHPDEVSRELRDLASAVTAGQRISC